MIIHAPVRGGVNNSATTSQCFIVFVLRYHRWYEAQLYNQLLPLQAIRSFCIQTEREAIATELPFGSRKMNVRKEVGIIVIVIIIMSCIGLF